MPLRGGREFGVLVISFALFVSFVGLVAYGGFGRSSDMELVARDGLLTLDGWDLATHGSVPLQGTWEFYWDQVIAPGSFADTDVQLTGYVPVPLYWTKYPGLNLPPQGVATYRLVVETDRVYRSLSMKTPELYTEYCLWVNGEPIDCHGTFDKTAVRYLHPDVYTFANDATTIEVVLQIRNQAHVHAGIANVFSSVSLGISIESTSARRPLIL